MLGNEKLVRGYLQSVIVYLASRLNENNLMQIFTITVTECPFIVFCTAYA